MAGKLRSSKMSDSVLEEGLRKDVRDMRDEMNILLWKIERSRDITQEGMKGIVRKGFEAMAGAMDRVMNGVGERIVEEKRRRDRIERALEERIHWIEDRDFNERKLREREESAREERLKILEQRMEACEKVRLAREVAIDEAVANLKEKVASIGAGQEGEWKEMTGRIHVLEGLLTVKDGSSSARKGELSERMKAIEEREKAWEEECIEKERIVGEKLRIIEEGLDRERKDREKLEKKQIDELERKEVKESEKEMERKVCDAMLQLKILNLRFRMESVEKVELLKEAENIMGGKVGKKDRKECELILRRSKVYILGKGTEEKTVEGEKICTAPVLVCCGTLVDKERLETMLRSSKVRSTFHWPKEMVDFVSGLRGRLEQMGYRKEEFFVKIRPVMVEGVPQLRAVVRAMVKRGGRFDRVACWSCPPAERRLWGNVESWLRPVWTKEFNT
jgi:hypothetical protein